MEGESIVNSSVTTIIFSGSLKTEGCKITFVMSKYLFDVDDVQGIRDFMQRRRKKKEKKKHIRLLVPFKFDEIHVS